MKRLWIAAAMLAAVLAATLWNSASLRTFTEEITELLQEAEIQASKENWEQASLLTDQAWALWQERDGYLHMTLRHADTDEIHAGFREAEALLSGQEYGEYAAANARLITHIQLLWESEAPTLKNFL